MTLSNSVSLELPYHPDSSQLFEHIASEHGSVFLDSGYPLNRQGRYDILSANPYAQLMTQNGFTQIQTPERSITSDHDPFQLLQETLNISQDSQQNLPFVGGAIGYFSYDLARRLEQLPDSTEDLENIPQMLVGLYDWAVVVDHREKRSWITRRGQQSKTLENWSYLVDLFQEPCTVKPAEHKFVVTGTVNANMTEQEYGQAFRKIKRYLMDGDCYQVNLAQRFSASCTGDPWVAYKALRNINPAPFSGYINFPEVQILSSSPERFLKAERGMVETKPIKGTRPRSTDKTEDIRQIEALKTSIKDRAENLMIVDLLRNDLGKTCALGSVNVPKLFDIESFATVHHLVSTVCGVLPANRDAIDLLRGSFPGGSITGAPKIRAMEIIEELEPHRRGVYCGSLGYIGYDGNMDTNIAIRTLVHSEGTIRFWAGGGIVADSVEKAEYQECYDKAAAMLELLDQLKLN